MQGGNEDPQMYAVIDEVLQYMLQTKGQGPNVITRIPAESELKWICKRAGDIFLQQDSLLELEAPIKVIILLLVYKIKYPEQLFMLRGNHECAAITRIYGFYDECKRRYNIKVWKVFCDVFNKLPFCAVIDGKVFCVHGGLSPEVTNMDQIRRISRPTDVPDVGMVCDFLWADPDGEISGWAENDRGVSYIFGPDIVSNFLKKHDFDVVVRAHQVVADGYEFLGGRKLVTVFSAPNYCGEFDNAGAMMIIDESLMCSFKVLKPVAGKK